MKAGDSFRLKDESIERHYPWVVLSDPSLNPAEVVVGNFTEWSAGKEQCCVCEPSNDSGLTKKSIFSYRDIKVVPLEHLRDFVAAGAMIIGQPVSKDILSRIHAGAGLSRFIPTRALSILEEQGVIPEAQ